MTWEKNWGPDHAFKCCTLKCYRFVHTKWANKKRKRKRKRKCPNLRDHICEANKFYLIERAQLSYKRPVNEHEANAMSIFFFIQNLPRHCSLVRNRPSHARHTDSALQTHEALQANQLVQFLSEDPKKKKKNLER